MRLLLWIILGVLTLTYAWGWVIDVHYGAMDTRRYTRDYMIEVKEQARFVFEGAEKFVSLAKRPIPRPAELSF